MKILKSAAESAIELGLTAEDYIQLHAMNLEKKGIVTPVPQADSVAGTVSYIWTDRIGNQVNGTFEEWRNELEEDFRNTISALSYAHYDLSQLVRGIK